MLLYKAFNTHVFKKKEVFDPYKPCFHHLKVYYYKAYLLIKLKSDLQY